MEQDNPIDNFQATPTEAEIAEQQKLLTAHRRTLLVYLSQRATMGSVHTPPATVSGITDARNEIRRIKAVLEAWGIPIANHPDDEALDEKFQLTLSPLGRLPRKTLTVAVISICIAGLLGLAIPIYRLQILPILTSSTTASATRSKYGDDWQVVFHDDFETTNSSWILGEDKDNNTLTNRYISNGKLVWEVEAKGLVFDAQGPAIDQISDFSLTVDGFQANGLRTIAYSLYFRGRPGEDYYTFSITKNQYWSFFIRANEKWVPIINWGKASVIKPNTSNKLKVVAEGEHFMFFINDELVGEGVDSRLKEGEVGIGVDVEGTEMVRFEFDNFELRTPQ